MEEGKGKNTQKHQKKTCRCEEILTHWCSCQIYRVKTQLKNSYRSKVLLSGNYILRWIWRCGRKQVIVCAFKLIQDFEKTTKAATTVALPNIRFNERIMQCTCVVILGTFLCRPLQNNNMAWQNSALNGVREEWQLIFKFPFRIQSCFPCSVLGRIVWHWETS